LQPEAGQGAFAIYFDGPSRLTRSFEATRPRRRATAMSDFGFEKEM
jgi:hypothetical protein